MQRKKRCSLCKRSRFIKHFYKNYATGRGLQARCKFCTKKQNDKWRKENRSRMLFLQKKWHQRNLKRCKQLNARSHVQRSYGLTPEEHKILRKKQKNRCAVCRRKAKLFVDHCHSSKKVRGLLCRHCNSALGFSRENPRILQKLIRYLRRNK